MSGLLRPHEVEEDTGLRLPESADSDTLGGLVTEYLGRLPEAGDVVHLEVRDMRDRDEIGAARVVPVAIDVVRVDGLRVDRVRVRRLGEDGSP